MKYERNFVNQSIEIMEQPKGHIQRNPAADCMQGI